MSFASEHDVRLAGLPGRTLLSIIRNEAASLAAKQSCVRLMLKNGFAEAALDELAEFVQQVRADDPELPEPAGNGSVPTPAEPLISADDLAKLESHVRELEDGAAVFEATIAAHKTHIEELLKNNADLLADSAALKQEIAEHKTQIQELLSSKADLEAALEAEKHAAESARQAATNAADDKLVTAALGVATSQDTHTAAVEAAK